MEFRKILNTVNKTKRKISNIFFRKSKEIITKQETGETASKEKQQKKTGYCSSGGAKYTWITPNGVLFQFEDGTTSQIAKNFGLVLNKRGAGKILKYIYIK